MSAQRSTATAQRAAAASGASVAFEQSLTRTQPPVIRPAQRANQSVATSLTNIAPGGESRDAATAAHAKRSEGTLANARSTAKAKSEAPRDRPGAAPLGTRIGVIADNHGFLDPAVLEIFAGVTHIIHAGDVMDPEILERLATVAPVTAVSGNMDSGQPTSGLPREAVGEVAGVRFLVGHKRKRLLRDLAAGAIEGLAEGVAPDLVIYGHDHIPAAAWVDGTLYLDPGSASAPHEEDDGPTVAIVEVRPAGLAVSFVPLERRRDSEDGRGRPKE